MSQNKLTSQEFSAHFPKKISKELCDYVTKVALKRSRYLFVKTSGNIQLAYCTHCKKQHVAEALKHKQEEPAICPHCKSKCRVQFTRYGRSRLEDRSIVVWYEKSEIEENAIVARVLEVARNYSGDFENVETMYNCNHQYLFRYGKGAGSYYRYGTVQSTVFSAFDMQYCQYRFRSDRNVKDAVKGTNFEYSMWNHYTKFKNTSYVSDMVEFFDLVSRYPCVEYLTKAGFSELVWPKLYKYSTHSAIHWRGKTLEKVLRISKQELRELQKKNIKPTPAELKFYQNFRKTEYKEKFKIEEIFKLVPTSNLYYKDLFEEALRYTDQLSAYRYLLKQLRTGKYESIERILTEWRDYRRQCRELKMSLKEDRFLFPNDLHQTHQELNRRIRIKRDRTLRKKIHERYKELKEQYSYEHDNLFVIPAKSNTDLFKEGQALSHCVGGYSKDYAEGECDLLFVRKINDPEKPFYTMEIVNGKIRQCRGYKNEAPTIEVENFVKAFEKEKLKKKSKRSA